MTAHPVFRRLWQPPGRYADRSLNRRVSFLELFFDLVFVVVIAEIAHRLSEHPSWSGVGWFVFLFYAVWSSWANGTVYYDLHHTNDLSVRVFTFAQMLAVAGLAVYAGDVPGDGSAGFAVAYAANTAILVVLWFRTGYHDPTHRPASVPYSIAYLISAATFAVSAGVGEPGRFQLWAVGLAFQIGGVLYSFRRWSPRETRGDGAVIPATRSLVERLGLFVIIVLGEVVVGAVSGMAEVRSLGIEGIVPGMLGILVAIGLWWLYFDLAADRAPVPRFTQSWLYLHFPLVIAIAAGGAAVLNTIEHSADPLPSAVRWLLVGALAVAILSTVGITLVLEVRSRLPAIYRSAGWAMVLSAAAIVGVGASGWGAKATLGAMAVLLLLPIAAGIVVWARSGAPEEAWKE